MIRFAAFCAILATLFIVVDSTRAQVVLPNLPAGTQYQIIFMTGYTTPATDPIIADYNTFATTQANENSTLAALGVQWNAVASTATVNANVNAVNVMVGGSYLPVYDTKGNIVSDQASGGLYSGSLLAPPQYDQTGRFYVGLNVWTGSSADGTGVAGYTLGDASGSAITGDSGATNGAWTDAGLFATTTAISIYALSAPITAVPEPSSFILLAIASLGLLRCMKR